MPAFRTTSNKFLFVTTNKSRAVSYTPPIGGEDGLFVPPAIGEEDPFYEATRDSSVLSESAIALDESVAIQFLRDTLASDRELSGIDPPSIGASLDDLIEQTYREFVLEI